MRGMLQASRLWVRASALAVSLGLTLPSAAQTDEQRAGARTLATEGALAFNEGRFKDAVDLFSRAESLVHAPPHLLFMARAHAKLGQLVKARETYLKIVREQLAPNAPQAFRDAQLAAEEERKQIEPKIGRLLIQIEGAQDAKDLSVTVDGQPFATVLLGVPQPMDPGAHTVTATATGYKAQPASVSLKEAESGSVTLKLEVDPTAAAPAAQDSSAQPAAPISSTGSSAPAADTGPGSGPSGLRIGSYAAFGVGAAGVALGTVFVLKSASKRKDADEAAMECNGCRGDSPIARKIMQADDDARSAQTMGIVGYVVGGVGVAAGVTLFVLSSKKEQESAYVTPYLGFGSLGVTGAF